ncbi:hypothetical protein FSP39_019529 [Pinctada imbricata]|uniref:DNA-directed RNA polymerase III subunit RPC8 n=1 Tax=Pinctada imbricata TaxID=66713 RepID=A0AA89BRH4_PINIB|nr:hypothetical protein FSP39_019529 [Pinctada imbricata]
MFVLAEMKDTVRIPPWLFHIEFKDAIIEALNKKLANKVVHNVGLCIALWDITKLEDSYIFPGDGASHTVVSLGLFDDIIIPADSMQHPSRFDDKEQLWAWEYQVEDSKHDLYMEIGEEVRLRVCEEIFVDTTPTGPDGTSNAPPEVSESDVKKAPFKIIKTHLIALKPRSHGASEALNMGWARK